MPTTRDRWRNRLPHWEVEDRPHFVTIRCAGSLPTEAQTRIREVHDTLQAIEPSDPNFARLQRQYFTTLEKYLDRTDAGFAPFRTPAAAQVVLKALSDLPTRTGWLVTHAVVMPNHLHALLRPQTNGPSPLREVIREFKGTTARSANRALKRAGPFWQRDWFDRWMRNETEEHRVIAYIANNPSKAGLTDWPWQIQ